MRKENLENLPNLSREQLSYLSNKRWAWKIVLIVFITVTAFIVAWVINTRTLANKDIRIEEIRTLKR